MFAGGFFRTRYIRRKVVTAGAILAFVGGLLVLLSSVSHGIVASLFLIFLALGAFVGAFWMRNAGKALLFPRARLVTAGLITAAIGVILFILGQGLNAGLVIAGGLIAWLATIV